MVTPPPSDVALGLLVATPTTWTLTSVPGHHRELVVPGEAAAQLHLEVRPAPPADGPLPGDCSIAAVWSWTGVIEAGHLTIETHDATTHRLDAHDVALLAAIDSTPTTADVLAAATGIDGAHRRLARLERLDLLRVADLSVVAARHEATAPEPVPAEPVRGDGPSPAPEPRVRTRRFSLRRRAPAPDEPAPTRIPVLPVWHRGVGPPLSLGMIVASARSHADITTAFDLHHPQEAEVVLDLLATHRGPAILLCSNYVWSSVQNLAIARRALERCPELLVVHGGPSTPKYAADAEDFLATNGDVAHILCRGEGEHQIVDLLRALQRSLPEIDTPALRGVAGLTYVDQATGTIVRTAEPERITDLDVLPSPYLTGEFDHIDPSEWPYTLAIETNRGCPYGCTFCDWGSSTLSRIRKFSVERVGAEVAWAAQRSVPSITLADANFGVMSRDVEIAERVASVHRTFGAPAWFSFTPAKNTTKHLSKIMDVLRDEGIVPTMSISLQTIDPTVLEALNRSNISTDHYLRLAADLRRRGHALQSDVLLGVPEQTYETFRADLQFNLDHEILARVWPVQLLPNSPMNDPEYRARYQIRANENGIVLSTSTFDEADRARMYRLRRAHTTFEVFALLRHTLRMVQWDHGLEATLVMDHLLDLADHQTDRIPRTTWLLTYFDLHTVSPGGWTSFYDEIRNVLVEDLDIPDDSVLDTVLRLDQFLMPTLGRSFPATIELAHDYVAYYRSAARSLFEDGHASTPDRPLHSYGPGTLTVRGDPLDLCSQGPRLSGDSRDEVVQGDFYMASTTVFELHSTLTRMLPHLVRTLGDDEVARIVAETRGPRAGLDPRPPLDDTIGAERAAPEPVRVVLQNRA